MGAECVRGTVEATNRYVLAQIILSDLILKCIRREIGRLSPELKITEQEIGSLLEAGVLKREVVDGERAKAAASLVRRGAKRRLRKSKEVTVQEKLEEPEDSPAESGEVGNA